MMTNEQRCISSPQGLYDLQVCFIDPDVCCFLYVRVCVF